MYQIKRAKRMTGPVMVQEQTGKLEYLTFPSLTDTGIVKHLFTTRMGGVSTGIFESLNLNFERGDDPEKVRTNYERVAGVLGCSVADMVLSKQTHTTNIRKVTEEDCGKGIIRPLDYTDVDGLITDRKGIVLVTSYADCVPLYFVDPVKKAIGLAHSGWRGTAMGMGQCMVEAMRTHSEAGRRICTQPSALLSARIVMRSVRKWQRLSGIYGKGRKIWWRNL